MNNWLGKDYYTTVHTPSYDQVRSAVMNSYSTGYATVVDEQELRGGPHFNGHNNGSFSHIMVVDGYNTNSDAVYIADPGAKTLWPGGSEHFWYPSLRRFVANHLQNEQVWDGLQHVGMFYVR